MSNSDLNFVIICSALSIGILLLIVVLGMALSRRKTQGFSPLRNFPYEMDFSKNKISNIIFRSLFFLVPLSYFPLIPICTIFVNGNQSGTGTFYLIHAICFILSLISLGVLFILDLGKFVKPHLIILVISMSLSLLAFAGFGTFTLNFNLQDAKSIVFCVISVIYIFVFPILVFGSKKNVFKLDKNVDMQGNVTLIRPKFFLLAFLEWYLVFGQILYIVLNLIEFITL
mgnify:CR=1 FL=1